MKIVGSNYLEEVLGGLIRAMLGTLFNCEVVSPQIKPDTLALHEERLKNYVWLIWKRIQPSHRELPFQIQKLLDCLGRKLAKPRRDKLMSIVLFDLFLCPAIRQPHLYKLCEGPPEEVQFRTLSLIASCIKGLGSRTEFSSRDQHLQFINELIRDEAALTMVFFQRLITLNLDLWAPTNEALDEMPIDCARYLAHLNILLKDQLSANSTNDMDTKKLMKTIRTFRKNTVNELGVSSVSEESRRPSAASTAK